jgi:hypothetical protein
LRDPTFMLKSCSNVDQKEYFLKTTREFKIFKRMIACYDNHVM